MSAKNQRMLKIILLGEAGVGKTCVLNRFVKNEFSKDYKATIGSDFTSTQMQVEDTNVNLQIWDTAGQERFRSLGPTFYRGSDCCVLVYDVTKKVSFDGVSKWRDEFIHQLELTDPSNFPFLLLGNKSDLENHVVTPAMAREYAESCGNMEFFEVSAKNADGVKEAFEAIIKKTLENMPAENGGFVLHQDTPKLEPKQEEDKKSGCC